MQPQDSGQQAWIQSYNIGGLNLYINPMLHDFTNSALSFDGTLIRAVNVYSYPVGAKTKRPGYIKLLGTTQNQGSPVNSLFSWTQDNGTQTFLYCFAGSVLSYYDVAAGTATDWLPCSNGTFTGTHVGHAILGDTMIVGDGVGSTRHTTDGTSFTNTTLAPVGEFFCQFQNRIYLAGTSSTLFYSTSGDATNWNIGGTSDSSSFLVPDAGKLGTLFVLSNNLQITKNSGRTFTWDGFNLYDAGLDIGPSSPYSYANMEGFGFWLSKKGIYSFQGAGASIISNPIQSMIFNDDNTGIQGTSYGTAPAATLYWDYYVAVGSVQDSFTKQPLNNAIIKYNYQQNEFLTYQFADAPISFGTYLDSSRLKQMVFGNSTGQVFLYGGTAITDNGAPIFTATELVYNLNQPHLDKDWRWWIGFFNPGAEAHVQVATTDTFTRNKNWVDLGDATAGVVKYRFPTGSRSKLLWIRITDNSTVSRYTYYGCSVSALFVNPG